MEQIPVRFASDENNFPNYSWRGYVVFSPIQKDILLDVAVTKASLYHLLLHYSNPTTVQIDTKVTAVPFFALTQG